MGKKEKICLVNFEVLSNKKVIAVNLRGLNFDQSELFL